MPTELTQASEYSPSGRGAPEQAGEERIAAINPEGKLKSIPVSELENARAAGWNLDPRSVTDAIVRRATVESGVGLLQTAAESAAAGAIDLGTALPTVGLRAGAALAGAVGADDTAAGLTGAAQWLGGRQQLARGAGAAELFTGGSPEDAAQAEQAYRMGTRERAAANPTTAALGYAAPWVVGGLATAPVGGLGAVGLGAAEGFAAGGAQANEAAYLAGNEGATGEHYLASGALGALLGGSTAGAFEGAGALVGAARRRLADGVGGLFRTRVTPEAAQEAAKRVLGGEVSPELGAVLARELNSSGDAAGAARAALGTDAADDLVSALGRELGGASETGLGSWLGRRLTPEFRAKLDEASAGITGGERSAIEKFAPWNTLDEAGRARVDRVLRAEANAEANKRTAREAFDELARAEDVIEEAAIGEGKVRNMGALLDPAQADDQAFSAAAHMRSLMAEWDDVGAGLASKAARTEHKQLSEYLQTKAASLAGSSQENVYKVLDETKRRLQAKVKFLGQSSKRITDPTAIEEIGALRNALEIRIQEPTRQFLEDASVWGAAGEAQAALNKNWTNMLREQGFFRRNFTEVTEQRYLPRAGGEVDVHTVTAPKIDALFNEVGTARAADRMKSFENYLESKLQLAEELLRRFPLDEVSKSKVADARSALQRIQKTIGEATEDAKLVNEYKQLLGQEARDVGAYGALAGSTVLGPVGAIAGGLAGRALGAPASSARMLLRLSAFADQNKAVIKRAISGYIGGGKASARGAVASGGQGQTRMFSASGPLAAVASQASAPKGGGAPIVAFGDGEPKQRTAQFRRAAGRISELASNSAQRQEAVQSLVAPFADAAPVTAAAVASKATAAIDYLNSILPAGADPRGFTPHLNRFEASAAEMARWGLAYRTVMQPMSVFDDLRRGTLTFQQTDALKAVYPEIYAQIQQATLELMMDRQVPVPYNKAVQLDLLCGLQGAGEPSMSPGFLQRVASLGQQAPGAEPRSSGAKPNISSMRSTDPLRDSA